MNRYDVTKLYLIEHLPDFLPEVRYLIITASDTFFVVRQHGETEFHVEKYEGLESI